jgi:cystathionine gamma-synthase
MSIDYCCHIPFGCSLPMDNPHAVSVSFPTLQNVIDYEEGELLAHSKMLSGYPRFFVNQYVKQLIEYVRKKHTISDDKIILGIASVHAKNVLEALTNVIFSYIEEDENIFLIIEKEDQKLSYYKNSIRNTGLLISSRQAEASLFKLGQIAAIFEEESFKKNAQTEVKSVLSQAYEVDGDNILLTNSGMNAFFAAFQTVLDSCKVQGRDTVVQMGWLYLDTIEIIEKHSPNTYLHIDISNKIQLETWLIDNHAKVACVITEVTTNPLIQCVDLPWLSNLCKKYNIVLIVDTTIATPFNIDVLPYCDIAVESLTKFASGGADILMGAIVLNPKSELIKNYREVFQKWIIPPYEGELSRLAFQIQGYQQRVEKIAQNTLDLYNYLKEQPFIKTIYSVFNPDFAQNFEAIKKSKNAVPGLLSIVFDKELAHYYDVLALAKGPSLGTTFTLAMPYVYLAHYDYLKTETGRNKLKAYGLNSELLRLSVGLEPVDKIIEAFEKLKKATINVKI